MSAAPAWMTNGGWSIHPGQAGSPEQPPDVWPSLMVWMERRQTEDPASLTFLDERIGELDEAARPTRDEKEALDELLKKALAPVSDADWIVVIDQLPDGGRRFFAAPRSASLARVWPAVFRKWQLERVPAIAARTVLDAYAKAGDEHATNATAERELTTAIRDALPGLLAVVGEPPHTDAHARAVEDLRAEGGCAGVVRGEVGGPLECRAFHRGGVVEAEGAGRAACLRTPRAPIRCAVESRQGARAAR